MTQGIDTSAMNPGAADAAADGYFAQWRAKLALWTGVLGGPLAWALQMQAGYALSRFSCPRHWLTVIHHVVTLLFLAAAVACTLVAWREWQRAGRGKPESVDGGVAGRSRFLAVLGIFDSGLFSLVIFAQWLPVFFVSPCFY